MLKANICIDDLKSIKYILNDSIIDQINYITEIFRYSGTIKIRFLSDRNEFSTILGHKVPKWVVGTSYINVVYIYVNGKSTEFINKLIIHEIVHVVIGKISNYRCPIWLNEAMAIYLSNQFLDMQLDNISIDDDCELYGDFYYEKCYLKLKNIMKNQSIENIVDAIKANRLY